MHGSLGGCPTLYFIEQPTFLCPLPTQWTVRPRVPSLLFLAPGSLVPLGKPGGGGTGGVVARRFCGPALAAGETRTPPHSSLQSIHCAPVLPKFPHHLSRGLVLRLSIIRPALAFQPFSLIFSLAMFFSPARLGQSVCLPDLALCCHGMCPGASSLPPPVLPPPPLFLHLDMSYLSFRAWLPSQLQNVLSGVLNPE